MGESAEQRAGDFVAGDAACANRGGKPWIDQRSSFRADVDALEQAAVRQQVRIEQRLDAIVHSCAQRAFRHVERAARLRRGAGEIHRQPVATHDHAGADRHRIAAETIIIEIRGKTRLAIRHGADAVAQPSRGVGQKIVHRRGDGGQAHATRQLPHQRHTARVGGDLHLEVERSLVRIA